MATKQPGTILIVDDSKNVLESLELFLKYKFKKVICINNPNRLPEILSKNEIDVVLLDMNFTAGVNTGNEGIFWLREILKSDASIHVIMITAYGDIELAVKAMKEGATDFIIKPWDNEKLLATIINALKLRNTEREVNKLKNRQKIIDEDIDKHFKLITGNSEKMKQVMAMVSKVAKTDANVLIHGENGTGKELIAREIHKLSKRNNESFVTIDLGTIHENLFESEMFGHLKGAFTDAKENRIGRIEHANRGTLFLDEISNIPLPLQAKLLSALETRKITPLGSNKEISINIRLISATNQDLNEMIENGLFREDLLYRINTVQIHLPPLCERTEEIILLADHYLKIYATKYYKSNLKFNDSAYKKLLTYNWPGNVRELKHSIERAVILSESDILKAGDFQFVNFDDTVEEINSKPVSLEEGEKIIIERALTRNNFNISLTAKELEIGRQTLYRKIEKYGL